MEERYLILSDIHGNVSAFESVLYECSDEEFAGIILLGDQIDYGMRSSEIISMFRELSEGCWKDRILANIWGNHEKLAIDRDLERLSTDRGRVMSKYTRDHLTEEDIQYIETVMEKEGAKEFSIGGKKCLAIHGSMEDRYWKSISPEDLRGDYSGYDIVLSGHSHYPYCFTYFYPSDNDEMRNKKAVVFINPGSVGQPRNQNPCAQYAVLSLPSGRVELRAVEYDVEYEQSLFPDEIDEFYKNRLKAGI